MNEEAAKVVVIGSEVSLTDVLDNRLQSPFDLESFQKFGRKTYITESINFLLLANALPDENLLEFVNQKLRIYIDGEEQINIGSHQRDNILTAITDNNPSTLKTALTAAIGEIEDLLNAGPFPAFLRETTIKKQVFLSKEEALWWHRPVTCRTFVTFPDPIDYAEVRTHSLLYCLLLPLTLYLYRKYDNLYLLYWIVYGLAARTLCGPKLDPQAFLVLFVLSPMMVSIGVLKHEFESGIPRRFSMAINLVMTVAGTACVLLSFEMVGLVIWGIAWLANLVLFLTGFCIGCFMFWTLVKLRLIPEAVCEKCQVKYTHNYRAKSIK